MTNAQPPDPGGAQCACLRVVHYTIPGDRAGLVIGQGWRCDSCGRAFTPTAPVPVSDQCGAVERVQALAMTTLRRIANSLRTAEAIVMHAELDEMDRELSALHQHAAQLARERDAAREFPEGGSDWGDEWIEGWLRRRAARYADPAALARLDAAAKEAQHGP